MVTSVPSVVNLTEPTKCPVFKSSPDWVMVSAMAFRGLALVGLTVVFLRSPLAVRQWPGERRSDRTPVTSSQTSTAPVTTGAAN